MLNRCTRFLVKHYTSYRALSLKTTIITTTLFLQYTHSQDLIWHSSQHPCMYMSLLNILSCGVDLFLKLPLRKHCIPGKNTQTHSQTKKDTHCCNLCSRVRDHALTLLKPPQSHYPQKAIRRGEWKQRWSKKPGRKKITGYDQKNCVRQDSMASTSSSTPLIVV